MLLKGNFTFLIYKAIKKKMERKETPAPYCHGELMEPIYRYKSGGVIYITWRCQFSGCQHTEELPLYYDEEDGESDEK
jgi:hypothetical protein